MINGVKPYPQMTDPGVPWLGKVPAQWKLQRMKTLLRERVQKGFPDEPLLAATQSKGVVRKEQYENRTVLALKDLHLLKLVCVGDFVISLRSFQGGIEYAREKGIISPAYTILRATYPEMHRYLARLFKSTPYIENLSLFVTGIRQGQNIDYEKLARAEVPVPPLAEQAAIVRFLDHVDGQMRRYIRAKQKLIRLLEEQKQAIIHRAVTRGLDPNVRLKPSGVEWLGNVPEHWDVLPLRRRWWVTDCKHLTVPFVDDADGIPLASVREVQSFELSLANAKRTTVESFKLLIEGRRQPHKGDLIYCRNVSVGAAAFVNTDKPMAMGQDVCLIRSELESQRYLNYFLHSPAMQHQLALLLVGSTFNRINVSDIKALVIVVPPRREQDSIVEFLDNEIGETTRVQTIAKNEMSFWREYRTRLIADVVTGKLDVRDAASQLPVDAAEPELSDEVMMETDDYEVATNDADELPDEAEA